MRAGIADSRAGGAIATLALLLLTMSGCVDSRQPATGNPPPDEPEVRSIPTLNQREDSPTDCRRWIAESGDDLSPGTRDAPWATLEHALDAIPESGCEIEVFPGIYAGAEINRQYTGITVLRAAEPYEAVLAGETTVLDVEGASNVTIEGFEIKQEEPESRGVIMNVEADDGIASTWITIRNNIIHDSFEDDLLKIRDAARHVTVSGNVFFNQAPTEQHIDVNGVHDILIENNIFSNDFEASGREDGEDTKAFIVVKDSSGTGVLGSRRVLIQRNVFLNWQGGRETLLQIGNDGKGYWEAIDVSVENNLILGNSSSYATAAFGAAGVKDVSFGNNTVVGDLPAGAFAGWFDQKGSNRPNQGIELRNNIFADPTGTMEDFTNGREYGLTLDNNLYWNDGEPLDDEGPVNPREDRHGLVADPRLRYDHDDLDAVIWDGAEFSSGTTTVRDEFVRLVEAYGTLPGSSPAVDAADPAVRPTHDILGERRGEAPDLGAFESTG